MIASGSPILHGRHSVLGLQGMWDILHNWSLDWQITKNDYTCSHSTYYVLITLLGVLHTLTNLILTSTLKWVLLYHHFTDEEDTET